MISSFQRSILIKEMRKKLEYWKLPETKAAYYKGLPTNSQVPMFAIERDNDGYYYLSDDLIAYCNLRNGNVFRMRKNWKAHDWACYNELYQLGIQSGRFRLDIPQYREELTVENKKWEYAELQSPNKNYGQNFNDDVFAWPELVNGYFPNPDIDDSFKDSVAQYYKEFTDQAVLVVKHAMVVAEKNGVGMPGSLGRPSTRFKDELGYFWSDFDQNEWTQSKDSVMQYWFLVFEGSLQFAKACGVLDDARLNDCQTYARTSWTTI